jgi:hypothetical protein
MTREPRKWRRWLALAIAAIAAWQVVSHWSDQRSGTDRLINQLWVERIPKNARDMVWHFVALDHRDRRIGALGRSSRWRVINDGIVWRQQGNQFTFVTPQNGCRSTLKVRTWKCAGQAPRPFELCLEFEGGGKHYRFYSRDGWVIKPRGELDADSEASFAAPALQAALATPADEESLAEADMDSASECAPMPELQ